MKYLLYLLFSILALNIFSQPTITSFSPVSGPVGTTVTITGTDFDPIPANNIVFFGATQANVSSASATSLTVDVPIGATHQRISVVNITTGLIAYSLKPFIVTFICGGVIDALSFAPKVDFPAGTGSYGIDAGDLNGDGKADLAIVNYAGANTVSVLKNTSIIGAVSFATKVDFATLSAPFNIAIGDLNGDGKPDMAVTDYASHRVSVFRNTSSAGSISFAPKVDLITGSNPQGISIGDIDGDGKPDIVVTNYLAITVSVLRNTTTGGVISFAGKVDFSVAANPKGVAIDDLNADGKLDLVVTNYGSASISVLKNTGSVGIISFAPKIDLTTGTNPSGVALSDYDLDNIPDIAVTNRGSNTMSIFRNIGTAGSISFAPKIDFATGSNPSGIDVEDLDGDGIIDLAVSNPISNTISVYKNTTPGGSISFAPKVDYLTATAPSFFTICDIDGNGKPDLSSANQSTNNASVIRNFLNLLLPPVPIAATGNTPNSFDANWNPVINATAYFLDVANDTAFSSFISGYNNLSVGNVTTYNVSGLLPNHAYYYRLRAVNGCGALTQGATLLAASAPAPPVTFTSFTPITGPIGTVVTITGTNFDPVLSNNKVLFGATAANILTASSTVLTVEVPIGTTFECISVTHLINASTAYSAEPFVVTFSCGGVINATSFAPRADYLTGGSTSIPKNVYLSDLDGDGKSETIVVNSNNSNISIFRNTSVIGTISYAPKIEIGTIFYGVEQFIVSDLDSDGKPELITTNQVFRNTCTPGVISFESIFTFSAYGTASGGVSVNDIDGDGRSDIIVGNASTNSFSVFRNTGANGFLSFASPVVFSTGSGTPRDVFSGDIDGDKKPDVVVGNNINILSVFRNLSTPGMVAFSSIINYSLGGSLAAPSQVVMGDINIDGKLDIVVGTFANYVSVFRNTSVVGTISLASRVDFTTDPAAEGVVISDIDGDGKPDLAAAIYGLARVNLFKNTSSGATISFAPRVTYLLAGSSPSVALGDLDGDQKPDMITANAGSDNISVFRNQVFSGPAMTSPAAATICSGTALNINLTSAAAATYTWIASNNPNVTGESTTTQTTSILNDMLVNTSTTIQTISYTVTATAISATCTGAPQVVTITVNPATAIMTSATSAIICSGSLASIPLTSNMPCTYTWIASNNPNTTGESTTTQTTSMLSNTITNPGIINEVVSYTVTPTSSAGCGTGAPQTVDITVKYKPLMTSLNTASICSGGTVTIPLTSNVPGTYTWLANNNANTTGESTTTQSTSTLNNTITNFSSTTQTLTYTVTPTANGCVGTTQTVVVSVYAMPGNPGLISGSSSICASSSNTYSITAVSGATSYNWTLPSGWTGSSTTNSISTTAGLTGGTITVTPGNICGSSSSQTLTVSVASLPLDPGTISGNINACPGSSNIYSITPVSGATSYTWTLPSGWFGSSTTEMITTTSGTSSGDISVTANNFCGSSSPQILSIVVDTLALAITKTNVSCFGSCDGSITPSASGGTGPYTYSGPLTGLCIGTYTVIGTDANGCTGSATVNITGPSLIVASNSQTNVTCYGFCDGNANLIASGGTPGYTYLWAPSGSTAATISSLCSGAYTCIITDSDGCTATATVTITQPLMIIPNSSGNISICPGTCTNLSALPTGGNGSPYSITWLPSLLTESPVTVCPSTTSSYTCTATDPMGCSQSEVVTVNIFTVAPLTYIQIPSVVCISSSPISLTTGTPAGGTYSGPGVAGNVFDPTTAGAGTHAIIYSFTDGNGCTDTAISSIFVDLCTDIQQVIINEGLIIYPNPFNSVVTLSMTESLGSIAIYNSQGKLVYSENVAKMATEIDLSELPNGIYLVRVQTEKNSITKNIIKE